MMDEKTLEEISTELIEETPEHTNLRIVVEVHAADQLDLAIRTVMMAFGGNPKEDRIGVYLPGGGVRVLGRRNLYAFAAQSSKGVSGVGGAGGALLPGLPNFDVATFVCEHNGCQTVRYRVGHRPGDPPPRCPTHDAPMTETP